MAIVRRLQQNQLEVQSSHTETQATWSLVRDKDGQRYLQVDTYGSPSREIPGKKSQSIRFSEDALRQIQEIIARHFSRS